MATAGEDVVQIPLDFAANLKCIVCGGFLSVAPIISGNNGKNVCGRCDFITYNKQERRNIIYEDVAKLMTFPCIFEKCTKRINWGDVEKHEKVCPYQTMACPKKECHESVLVREIVAHFSWTHKLEKSPTVIISSFDVNNPNFDSPRLLICREKPYLCFCYKNDSFIGVGVYSLDPYEDDNTRYFVSLTSNNAMLVKGKQKILPFVGRIHCAYCFEGSCTRKHHKYSANYKNNSTQELHSTLKTRFEVDAVKKTLETDVVTLKITLTDANTGYTAGTVKKRRLSEVAGKDSECEVCKTLTALPELSKKLGVPLADAIQEQIKLCSCKLDVKDALGDFDVSGLIDDIKEEDGDHEVLGNGNGGDNGVAVVEAENSADFS